MLGRPLLVVISDGITSCQRKHEQNLSRRPNNRSSLDLSQTSRGPQPAGVLAEQRKDAF